VDSIHDQEAEPWLSLAHLSGKVAEALMAKAAELFAEPPQINHADVLAARLPGAGA
jgi:hypothetical protein